MKKLIIAASIKERCTEAGWHTISMRDDWKTIYGEDVERNLPTAVSASLSASEVGEAFTLDGKPVSSSFRGIVVGNSVGASFK